MKMKQAIGTAMILLVATQATAQDELPTPVPDPVPNAIQFGGPISDAIERRIADRIRDEQKEMLGSLLAEIQQAREERNGILASIIQARAERVGILEEIKQIRNERSGIIARLASMSSTFDTWRVENKEQRSDWLLFTKRFAPLENLATLIKWLFWLVAACCLLLVLIFVMSVYDKITNFFHYFKR